MNGYAPHRPPLVAWAAAVIAALGMMSCEARADEVILTETPGEPVWATITVKNRCGSPPSYEDVIDTHRGPVTVEWTRSLPCWTPTTPGVGPDVLTILETPPGTIADPERVETYENGVTHTIRLMDWEGM